jgi:hypothetical protein
MLLALKTRKPWTAYLMCPENNQNNEENKKIPLTPAAKTEWA